MVLPLREKPMGHHRPYGLSPLAYIVNYKLLTGLASEGNCTELSAMPCNILAIVSIQT